MDCLARPSKHHKTKSYQHHGSMLVYDNQGATLTNNNGLHQVQPSENYYNKVSKQLPENGHIGNGNLNGHLGNGNLNGFGSLHIDFNQSVNNNNNNAKVMVETMWNSPKKRTP